MTEQLRYQLIVWSFTTARASSAYFEVRHHELRSLNGISREEFSLVFCMLEQVICQWFFTKLFVDVNHFQSLVTGFTRTLNRTQTTAYTVCRSNLDTIFQVFNTLTHWCNCFKFHRCCSNLFLC